VGFKHTIETRNKISNSLTANKNSHNQPTAIPVQVMDLKTGEITKYISARKAALALNISNSTVMKKLREKSGKPALYKNRYVFKVCECLANKS
jgi:hypothetical protein